MLFALALFLVAVGQRFRLRGMRSATTAIAFGLFTCGLYEIVSLPRL